MLATLERSDSSGDADAACGSAAAASDSAAAHAVSPHALPRLPLAVRVDGQSLPLPVRFLLPEEEGDAAQAALLRRWLDLVPPGAPGLPPGVVAFSLPPEASAASLMRLVEATVAGEDGQTGAAAAAPAAAAVAAAAPAARGGRAH